MISPLYTGPVYEPNQGADKVTGTESGMGQDAFLKMFMAQMTNQNPLDPMDNTEFTAQLAQFSSLEQLTKISESLESIDVIKQSVDQATVLSYLGKEAVFYGEQLPVTQGYVGEVGYDLAASAQVMVNVYDEAGSLVKSYSLGTTEAGRQTFQWDGTGADGNQVKDGVYRIHVSAYDSWGEPVEISGQTASALVTGYEKDQESGDMYILLGDVALSVSDVLAVRLPPTTQSNLDLSTLQEYLTSGGAQSQSTSESTDSNAITDFLSSLASLGGLAAALL